jgi:hypothetical protein
LVTEISNSAVWAAKGEIAATSLARISLRAIYPFPILRRKLPRQGAQAAKSSGARKMNSIILNKKFI